MVPRCFREEGVLAGLPAEAHAPMVIADKTKPSTTVYTAIFELGHVAIFQFRGHDRHALSDTRCRNRQQHCRSLPSAPRALRSRDRHSATSEAHIVKAHCRNVPAKLIFRNTAACRPTLRREVPLRRSLLRG